MLLLYNVLKSRISLVTLRVTGPAAQAGGEDAKAVAEAVPSPGTNQ